MKFGFQEDKLHAYRSMLCDYKFQEFRKFAPGHCRVEKLSVVMEIFWILTQKTSTSTLLRLWQPSTWNVSLCSPILPVNTLWAVYFVVEFRNSFICVWEGHSAGQARSQGTPSAIQCTLAIGAFFVSPSAFAPSKGMLSLCIDAPAKGWF